MAPEFQFFITDISKQLEIDLLETGFAYYDGTIHNQTLQELQQEVISLHKNQEFKEAQIKGFGLEQRVPEIRGDWIFWLPDEPQTPLQNKIAVGFSAIKQHLNSSLFLGIDHINLHYARYPIGAFYKKHLDQPLGKSDRILTIVLYLNSTWQKGDGGELKIYFPNSEKEPLLIEPLWGRIVFFLSDVFTHEVLPCQKPRTSLTGWFRKRPL